MNEYVMFSRLKGSFAQGEAVGRKHNSRANKRRSIRQSRIATSLLYFPYLTQSYTDIHSLFLIDPFKILFKPF